MVEVTHGIPSTLIGEDSSQPLTSPKLHVSSGRPSDDHMATIRRTAASKRSLLRMRASGGPNSRSHSDLSSSRDESKSPSSPGSSADEDPKRSKAERSSSYSECSPESPKASPDGQVKSLFQRRARNHSAPIFLTSIENCVAKTSNSPAIVCEVSVLPRVCVGMCMCMRMRSASNSFANILSVCSLASSCAFSCHEFPSFACKSC